MKVEKYDFYALDTITLRSEFADSLNVLISNLLVAYNDFSIARESGICSVEYVHVVNRLKELQHVIDFLAVNKLLRRKVYEEVVDFVGNIVTDLKDYEELNGGY